jgi:hypothetical protein
MSNYRSKEAAQSRGSAMVWGGLCALAFFVGLALMFLNNSLYGDGDDACGKLWLCSALLTMFGGVGGVLFSSVVADS